MVRSDRAGPGAPARFVGGQAAPEGMYLLTADVAGPRLSSEVNLVELQGILPDRAVAPVVTTAAQGGSAACALPTAHRHEELHTQLLERCRESCAR